jgi:hypothetical protein
MWKQMKARNMYIISFNFGSYLEIPGSESHYGFLGNLTSPGSVYLGWSEKVVHPTISEWLILHLIITFLAV